uniref:C2 NT-type domain-containing protein n=1 Tax=Timspurckia oligopyrenoides TaxID=708627 RepID=A0A6T6NJQ6_9RHOD|mmetsp:Transcript_7537/g.13640  ORF Transcript_7537/g.13640 Transcript_7537/m.13640 type:complete len:481 (+) Transcript_7537:41-1483(+)
MIKNRSLGGTRGLGSAKRGIGHLNQTPFQFEFEFRIEKVSNIKTQAKSVLLVLERREQLESTSLVPIVSGQAVFPNQTLKLDSTLFQKSTHSSNSTEKEFAEKMTKMALRLDEPRGKTIGKLHFDLSLYARTPSGSVNTVLELSNGASVHLTISSQYLAAGRRKVLGISRSSSRSSAASVSSGLTTGSGGLGRADSSIAGDDFLDDLDDLDDLLSDDDKLETSTKAKKSDRSVNIDLTSPESVFISSEGSKSSSSPLKSNRNPSKPKDNQQSSLQSVTVPTQSKTLSSEQLPSSQPVNKRVSVESGAQTRGNGIPEKPASRNSVSYAQLEAMRREIVVTKKESSKLNIELEEDRRTMASLRERIRVAKSLQAEDETEADDFSKIVVLQGKVRDIEEQNENLRAECDELCSELENRKSGLNKSMKQRMSSRRLRVELEALRAELKREPNLNEVRAELLQVQQKLTETKQKLSSIHTIIMSS